MDIQPLNDWLVVKAYPLDKRSSIIEMPGQNESGIRKGEIVAVGPGRRSVKTGEHIPMDVRVGEKCVFFRWHHEHRPGVAQVKALEKISLELGADLRMVRENDILFTYTDDVKVDV